MVSIIKPAHGTKPPTPARLEDRIAELEQVPPGRAVPISETLSFGPACLALMATEHQVRKAMARGVINPPKFAGRFAVFPVAELPAYRLAMEQAGIVQPRPPVAPALAAAAS